MGKEMLGIPQQRKFQQDEYRDTALN